MVNDVLEKYKIQPHQLKETLDNYFKSLANPAENNSMS
jgi:Tfp pilus assembly protein PilP